MSHLCHFGYNKNFSWKIHKRHLYPLINACQQLRNISLSDLEKSSEISILGPKCPIYNMLGKIEFSARMRYITFFMCILKLTSCEKSEKNYEPILRKQADEWIGLNSQDTYTEPVVNNNSHIDIRYETKHQPINVLHQMHIIKLNTCCLGFPRKYNAKNYTAMWHFLKLSNWIPFKCSQWLVTLDEIRIELSYFCMTNKRIHIKCIPKQTFEQLLWYPFRICQDDM